jgi:hypothetical protein
MPIENIVKPVSSQGYLKIAQVQLIEIEYEKAIATFKLYLRQARIYDITLNNLTWSPNLFSVSQCYYGFDTCSILEL